MKHVSSRTAFWIVAWALVMSLWSSAAPSIMFPLYASQWHLSKSITTGIFAMYPIVIIVVLVVLGNISDYFGRRNTLITGLLFLLAGALTFALAPNMYWLFFGRAMQGTGVGLAVGSGAAALVEFNPTSNKKLPGSINTITQAVGVFLGQIVGAILIKYAPFPLHLSYWVLSAFVCISIILCLFLPQNARSGSEGRSKWKPAGIKVPDGLWGVYILAVLAVGMAFSYGGVFLSLGAQIARDVVGTKDILVIGTVLSISNLLIAVSATIAGRMGPLTSIRAGMIAIILTFVLLVMASELHSFALFIISSIVGGLGYGFSAAGGIALAALNSPPAHRAQFLSAVFLCYLFQGASSYGGGLASTVYGFSSAIRIVSVVVGLVALMTLLLTLIIRIRKSSEAVKPKPIG
ncbi:putative MFS family arabinose efflux permease [Paenibacillus taihuensis]|uniref:Putative MFS family arabinose efflux permease n=1 Tax=Paenibacillus taihuensis TaxID=1156355 RepID=A0A3D9QV37_9BACL|nr:MFS transporter [Paenibacillus taihuensis]REE68094.1 putative MFS family arabinose efflux permease [Paenibacillus taihuensis]